MYSPLHATTGILLAQVAPNPAAAFLIAMGSHYVLDAIPHGDMRPLKVLDRMPKAKMLAIVEPIDLGLTALLLWFFLTTIPLSPAILVAGAIGGIFPDILWGSKFVLKHVQWKIPGIQQLLNWHHNMHEGLHAKARYDIPHAIGIGYQVLVLLGIVGFYLG